MPGFIKDEPTLANGIPNRTISPETGSSGNATMTNAGGTSEGSNEAFDSRPPPAAGLGRSGRKDGDVEAVEEERTFSAEELEAEPYRLAELDEDGALADRSRRSALDTEPDLLADLDDEESAAQQIADGSDRPKHGKSLHDHK